MTDLIKKAIYGDADAFLELMDVNSLAMYKVAKGILGNDDDVADAVQNTILTCFEKLNTLKKPRYFKTWMIRILINECNKILSHYKKFNWSTGMKKFLSSDKWICLLPNLNLKKCSDVLMRLTALFYCFTM